MADPKFTFKKEARETGLATVARPEPDTRIKLKGKEVGMILAPHAFSRDDKWEVWFIIDDTSGGNSDWKWTVLKKRFDTEPEAREWLQARRAAILNQFAIHPLDPED